MSVRIDDSDTRRTHEQTHDIRSRSRNERPHYGWRRISICTAGTPAFVRDLFRSPARRPSMVDVALLLRRVRPRAVLSGSQASRSRPAARDHGHAPDRAKQGVQRMRWTVGYV